MTEKKICVKCKHPKDPEQDFNRKTNSKDGLQPYCKDCSHAVWSRAFPKERRVARNREYRAEVKSNIAVYLSRRTCVKCGGTNELNLYPQREISQAISRKYASKRMQSVVEACTILCRDCNKNG